LSPLFPPLSFFFPHNAEGKKKKGGWGEEENCTSNKKQDKKHEEAKAKIKPLQGV